MNEMKKLLVGIVGLSVIALFVLAGCGAAVVSAPPVTTAIEPVAQTEPATVEVATTVASWHKVAQMTTTSPEKNGELFTVRGDKQKLVIKYSPGSYGAGASGYVFLKGDTVSDGYTEMIGIDSGGSESSILYLDAGSYYFNLGAFGGRATLTLYDHR